MAEPAAGGGGQGNAHPTIASNISISCLIATNVEEPNMKSSGFIVLKPAGFGGMPIGITPGCCIVIGCCIITGCAIAIGAAAGICTWNCWPGATPSGICV